MTELEHLRKEYMEKYLGTHNKEDRVQLFENLHSAAVNLSESNYCKTVKQAYIDCFKGYQLRSKKYIKKNDKEVSKPDYFEAIKSFEKVFELKCDDEYVNAYAHNGIGYISIDQKQYEQALKHLHEAVNLENYFYAYCNLGIVYLHTNNLNEAMKWFKQAIDAAENKDIDFFYAKNNLAAAYWKLAEDKKAEGKEDEAESMYELAKEFFEAAIQGSSRQFSHALRQYGLFLYARCRFKITDQSESFKDESFKNIDSKLSEARGFLENAKKRFHDHRDKYLENITEENIKELDNVISSYQILKGDKLDPELQILKQTEIYEMARSVEERKKRFLDFILVDNVELYPNHQSRNYIKFLRRWNSYTPIVADNYHFSKGGGYFIKLYDKGIVVDPGFNFIENFKEAGHRFPEIDYVFISHAHNDHTADLESILTLLHKHNKEIEERKKGKKLRNGFDKYQYLEHLKQIHFYMPSSVFKKFSGLFQLISKENYIIHLLEAGNEIKIETDKLIDQEIELKIKGKENNKKVIKVEVLRAQHHDIISDMSSVGFLFHTDKAVIVYTGDTGWNDDDIEKQYENIRDKNNNKRIILIAHLGGFKEYELFKADATYKGKTYYSNHLGRLGMVRINETLKPDICFISEFGEEFKTYRCRLTEAYDKIFNRKEDNKKAITFIPVDIGLKYDIDNNSIKAITNLDSVVNEESLNKSEYISIEQVCTMLLKEDFSLNYYQNGLDKEKLEAALKTNFQNRLKKSVELYK